MSRIPALTLAALVLPLAFVANACSESAKTAPLAEWVDGLCDAALDFNEEGDAAGETFASADFSNTKAAKAAFAESIELQREAQKNFRTAFDRLGRPDIEGGKQVVDAFRDQFQENTERTDDVARRVAAIPNDSEFISEFLDIVEAFEEPDFRSRIEAVAADYPEVQNLIAAIEEDPDCASVIFQTESADAEAEAAKETWVSGICTALGGWVVALSAGADQLSSNVDAATTPAQIERILVDFFEQALTDTRTLQRQVARLSPPPVKDGEAIHAVFANASDDLVAALERLTREARDVDFSATDQAIAEAQRLEGLIDQLFNDVATSFDELQQYEPEGLDTYFQTLPECQF